MASLNTEPPPGARCDRQGRRLAAHRGFAVRNPLARVTALLAASLLSLGGASGASVTEGRKAWLRLNCYGCHGDNGAGGGQGPSVRGQTVDTIRSAMMGAKGAGGMRSYIGVPAVKPRTDPADIDAYLKSVGTPAEPKWHDWWRR